MPTALVHEANQWASELLARRFRPSPENEASARRYGFNYVVSIFSEWRGKSFYLCAKYRSARAKEEFVVRTTRLDYTALNRFNLSYFRHTSRWQLVYTGMTVGECFDTIEQEEIFWPIT